MSDFRKRVLTHLHERDNLILDAVEATRYLKDRHGYSLSVLVVLSGLHKNSLLRLNDPNWEPDRDTFLALASIVDHATKLRQHNGRPMPIPKRGRPSHRSSMEDVA